MDAGVRRRLAVSFVIALAVGVALGVAHGLNLFAVAQLQGNDFLFRAGPSAATRRVASHVTIVAIADSSLARLGPWLAWPRAHYARVVRALDAMGARLIVLDVGFVDAKPDDAELAAALREVGSVVQPVVGWPNTPRPMRPGDPLTFSGTLGPVPTLRDAAPRLGHANVLPDGDGAVRTMPLFVRAGNEVYPALGLLAAALFLDRPPLEGALQPPVVLAAGRAIPVDDAYRMIVDFAGPPSHVGQPSAFAVVSFVDVLEGRTDPALVRDRVVFVGQLDATGHADDYWVPTSQGTKMWGVELHANVFATIVSGSFYTRQGAASTIATALGLAGVVGLAVGGLRILWAGGLAMALLALYLLAVVRLFDAGLLLNTVYPPLSVVLAFLGATVYRVVFEAQQVRERERILGQYLAPAVVQTIVRQPQRLRLGGEKRVMTVLFADIRGFTSIAEGMDPEALTAFLNEYLSAMTDVVFKHDGVLDKYMGDGIMAFWGAPIEQPDHAARACRTALEMVRVLDGLQRQWQRRGIPPLDVGIGINTGPMSVGNMGSNRRFDYTVLGDAVNLAARLEEITKEYGASVLVGEATWQAVRHQGFVVRFLDLVQVRGKDEPVAVYELLGADGAPERIPPEALRRYEEAMALYRKGRYREAEEAFRGVLALAPHDGPSVRHVRRCQALLGGSTGTETGGPPEAGAQ